LQEAFLLFPSNAFPYIPKSKKILSQFKLTLNEKHYFLNLISMKKIFPLF